MIILLPVTEHCVRCAAPAGTIMSFAYEDRVLWLDDLSDSIGPEVGYPMCQEHAGRLTPPVGWTLVDRRTAVPPLFVSLEVA